MAGLEEKKTSSKAFLVTTRFDEFVISPTCSLNVIPAKLVLDCPHESGDRGAGIKRLIPELIEKLLILGTLGTSILQPLEVVFAQEIFGIRSFVLPFSVLDHFFSPFMGPSYLVKGGSSF